MAAIIFSRRATVSISKVSSGNHPCYVDSATRLSRACSLSTAYERVEGLSNAVAESSDTRGEGTGPDGIPGLSSDTRSDPVSQGIYEAKQQPLDPDEQTQIGATQCVADTAKRVKKVTEIADTVEDTAKKTMDGAWKATKEANEKIRETVVGDFNKHNDNNNETDPIVHKFHKLDGSVDTVEYRSIEDNIEDLKVRSGDKTY